MAEGRVCGQHLALDDLSDLTREALLLVGRDARRELLRRQQERVGGNDPRTLRGYFLEQKAHGHQLIPQARPQDLLRLRENAWNLMQPRDVVLVVPDGVERH